MTTRIEVMDLTSKSRGLGLKVALGDGDMCEDLTTYIFEGDINTTVDPSHAFAPFSHFTEEETNHDIEAEDDEPPAAFKIFHRNEKGKVAFTSQKADAASDYVASMELDKLVKTSLQKKRCLLPQETKECDEYYCNESTYLSLNVLIVTGPVKLSDSGADKPTPMVSLKHDFDARPTKEQMGDAVGKLSSRLEEIGMRLPDSFYESDFYEGDY